MRYADLFAGAGGAHLGLQQAGLTPVAAVEWDAAACQVLTDAGWPTEPTDVRAWLPVEAMLWWASPPCQAFSSAGKRLGQGDERNGWPWLIDALDRAIVKPIWLIAENVAGMTHHRRTCPNHPRYGHRNTIPIPTCNACYLAVILQELQARFAYVSYRVLNCADYGIPQKRRRVIIVAGPEVYEWPKPTHSKAGDGGLLPWVSMGDALGVHGTFEPLGHSEYATPSTSPTGTLGTKGNAYIIESGGTRGGTAAPALSSTAGPAPTVTDAGDLRLRLIGAGTRPHGPGRKHERTHRDITHEPAPCVTAAQVGNAGPWVEGEQRRRLTVRECGALQTFPPDWPWYGTKEQQYRQVGNAVPPLLAKVLGRALPAQEQDEATDSTQADHDTSGHR